MGKDMVAGRAEGNEDQTDDYDFQTAAGLPAVGCLISIRIGLIIIIGRAGELDIFAAL